jgi:hypothetical protein
LVVARLSQLEHRKVLEYQLLSASAAVCTLTALINKLLMSQGARLKVLHNRAALFDMTFLILE